MRIRWALSKHQWVVKETACEFPWPALSSKVPKSVYLGVFLYSLSVAKKNIANIMRESCDGSTASIQETCGLWRTRQHDANKVYKIHLFVITFAEHVPTGDSLS